MTKLRTNPYLVGAANALLPGLGYLLIDERKVFGWLLLAGSVLAVALSFVEQGFLAHSLFTSQSAAGRILESGWYLCFVAAYAYDAFALAKAKRKDLHPMITTSNT